jgi:hypothetical protein
VKAGEEVAPDHVINHNLKCYKGQTVVDIPIYATSNNSLKYTDATGMEWLGEMVLQLPEPCADPDGDILTVSLTFGQMELLAKAWVIESVDAVVEFDRTV